MPLDSERPFHNDTERTELNGLFFLMTNELRRVNKLRRDAKRDCQRQEASCKRAESGPNHITVIDKATEDTFAE